MQEYDGVKFKIQTVDIIAPSSSEHEEYTDGYVYYIDSYDYESPEWYETESEAVIAAEDMIGRLDSEREGPGADYDISPGYEDHE